MLGGRFEFETPNAIDAGDEPPTRPARSFHTTSPTSTPKINRNNDTTDKEDLFSTKCSPISSLVRGERLFRGTKIRIEEDHNSSSNNNDSDFSAVSYNQNNNNNNMEGAQRFVTPEKNYNNNDTTDFDDDRDPLDSYEDEPIDDMIPSASAMEARRFATKLLKELEQEDDIEATTQKQQANLSKKEFRTPLAWRRPSRRKTNTTTSSTTPTTNGKTSWIYMSTNALCGLLLLGTALAFFVLVTVAIVRNHHKRSSNNASNDNDHLSPRFDAIVDWLDGQDISDPQDLLTQGTPQFQAAVWMADMDDLQYSVPPVKKDDDANHTTSSAGEVAMQEEESQQFLQRYVLAVFFFSLGGETWSHSMDFLTQEHACGWFRTETGLGGLEYSVGVTCDSDLMVRDLFIPNNNLQGSIPSELQHLPRLELLSVRHNFLSSTIPEHLQDLTPSLQYLDLSKNSFTGTIPSGILERLTGLKVLGLGDNHLNGTVPESLGMLDLVTLDLSGNALNGRVSAVMSQLTSLEYLYLGNNVFDDTLDDMFLIGLSNLRDLILNGNNFQGQLPRSLLSHPTLTTLDLSDNFISDTLPDTFWEPSKLTYLDLSTNDISGSIPLDIQSFTDLQYLGLSRNKLTSNIPVTIGNMKTLKYLLLSDNTFTPGNIPSPLFTLENLRELELENISLTGQIPTWFGLMSNNLESLKLTGNQLTGTIPKELWGLSKLSVLILSDNQLNDTLSVDDIGPPNGKGGTLEILALDENNAISGDISGLCESLPTLQSFAYACDQITCSGHCCHSECCEKGKENADQCFAALIGASLRLREAESSFGYHANRTIHSFSPNIILRDSLR